MCEIILRQGGEKTDDDCIKLRSVCDCALPARERRPPASGLLKETLSFLLLPLSSPFFPSFFPIKREPHSFTRSLLRCTLTFTFCSDDRIKSLPCVVARRRRGGAEAKRKGQRLKQRLNLNDNGGSFIFVMGSAERWALGCVIPASWHITSHSHVQHPKLFLSLSQLTSSRKTDLPFARPTVRPRPHTVRFFEVTLNEMAHPI